MSPSRATPWASFIIVVAATATLHIVWAALPPAPSPPSPSCSLGPPPTLCKQCSNRSLELLQKHFGEMPSSIPFEPECQFIFAGCKDDGVGAQAQAKLSAYAFAKAVGKVYVHVPFLTVGHFKDEQEAGKVAQEMEEFFNLGFGEMSLKDAAKENVTVCAVKHCHNFLDVGGQACWEPVQEELRRKYDSSPKPEPFHNSSRLTVAIHVRRGDVDPSSVVIHANGKWMRHTPDDYYIATLDVLNQALPKHMRKSLDVVLLSEGQPSDFESILKAHPGVRLVLNGDIRRALHTLVTADVLITARSSFSYTAALYNSGIVIYEPFWHVQHPGWIKNQNPFAQQAEQANVKGSSMNSLLQQLKAASTKKLLEKRLRERSVRMR